jgi:hypothetical protein
VGAPERGGGQAECAGRRGVGGGGGGRVAHPGGA